MKPDKPAARTPTEWRPYRSRLTADGSPYLGKEAFTLLEVLLALALFAGAVVVLASSYLNIITSLEAVKTDRAFDQQVRWVRDQVLQEPDLKLLEKGGELRTPDAGVVRWQASVTPALVADLFAVELRVEMTAEKSGKSTLREHTERLTVLRPSWSEPVERSKLFEEAKQRIEEERQRRGVISETAGKAGKRT